MYYSAIPSSRRPWKSFSECVDYFTIDVADKAKYPSNEERWRKVGFLENLAYVKNEVFKKEPSKVTKSLKALADATTLTKIPTEKSFTDAFIKSATEFTFNDFKKATSEGLKEFGAKAASVAAVGVGTYLAWLTFAAVGFFALKILLEKAKA